MGRNRKKIYQWPIKIFWILGVKGKMSYKLIMQVNENKKTIYFVEDSTGRRVSPIYKWQSAAKKFYAKLEPTKKRIKK